MTKSTPTLTQSGLLAALLQRQRYRVFHLTQRSAHRKRVQAAFWNTLTWARRQRWSTGRPHLNLSRGQLPCLAKSTPKPTATSTSTPTSTPTPTPERNAVRTDTERVLTVLLALALALLTITTFALAKAQQRYTAAQWYQAK